MPEAFVQDKLHRNAPVFQRLVQLESIGRRDAFVLIPVLDKRGRFRLVHIGDWRSLPIDLRIVPGCRLQVLSRERMDVGIHVVSGPVRDPRADRHGLEPVAVSGDERRDITALAPTHGAHAIPVDHALAD